MNILIVEDDELIAMDMERLLSTMDLTVIGIAERSEEALDFLDKHEVDLILMDIQIKGSYDGIELSGLLGEYKNIELVYVTSMVDDLNFNRAARTNPAGFIVKPFTEIQFTRTIRLIENKIAANNQVRERDEAILNINDQSIFIKKKQTISKIQISDIFYLEADGGTYSRIITGTEIFIVRKPLKEIVAKINDSNFVYCHRSYVVNISKIVSVDLKDDQILFENRRIPLSRREKESILSRLNYL